MADLSYRGQVFYSHLIFFSALYNNVWWNFFCIIPISELNFIIQFISIFLNRNPCPKLCHLLWVFYFLTIWKVTNFIFKLSGLSTTFNLKEATYCAIGMHWFNFFSTLPILTFSISYSYSWPLVFLPSPRIPHNHRLFRKSCSNLPAVNLWCLCQASSWQYFPTLSCQEIFLTNFQTLS